MTAFLILLIVILPTPAHFIGGVHYAFLVLGAMTILFQPAVVFS